MTLTLSVRDKDGEGMGKPDKQTRQKTEFYVLKRGECAHINVLRLDASRGGSRNFRTEHSRRNLE